MESISIYSEDEVTAAAATAGGLTNGGDNTQVWPACTLQVYVDFSGTIKKPWIINFHVATTNTAVSATNENIKAASAAKTFSITIPPNTDGEFHFVSPVMPFNGGYFVAWYSHDGITPTDVTFDLTADLVVAGAYVAVTPP